MHIAIQSHGQFNIHFRIANQSAYSLGTSKWWKRQNLTENFKWKKEALLMLPPKLLLCHWKIAIWIKLKRSYGILKNNHNFEGMSFLTVRKNKCIIP